ncbi:MAG: helix-turn-helix domain-containing protein [Rhodospirillaceae bacterium]|jgi:MerR family transcriptional regulator, mercuric resistance operon regulatory protein|nr:helix-turn-helix domain-containing protein [Rhodospirillaceae bacterium]MBT3493319.1 helix-turn-helix domain-containing protein [Rhodospirillaceae bacterium]MBT3780591.1 helix-turn-helix domain-containing protein [Rhodospirillaceae bacterium]MBT3976284.1 helix-turn-helix domain-containing protein [Rhodospirillaceae bacterium]MBT4169596.1 helix-turn-helix domain-containing protein [Rhodospirillaceae bacterium]
MAIHTDVTARDSQESVTLSIGALSKRTGVHLETVRYYENIGIMPAPPRSPAGHRRYDREHLKRLTFVKRSRELGFTLKEIRALLALVDGGDYTCGEVHELTVSHLHDVREKIADLQRLETTLAEISEQCADGTIPDCPFIETLFR